MTTHVIPQSPSPQINSSGALRVSVTSWVLVVLIGQWFFSFYLVALYAIPFLSGHPENINSTGMITGYVDGDGLGNGVLFAHVIPAAILSFCGVLQLVPQLRSRCPGLHRWNGRLFLVMGLMGAFSGLYLNWVRGSRLSDFGSLGITLNGLLIPLAVALAWRFALKRDFVEHRRWAIHSFLLVNGVWTFRLYLMGWYMVNQGPNGNTQNLDGPADIAISYACYLLPMAVAELVIWAQRQQQTWKQWWVSGLMAMGFLITLGGIAATTLMMWIPRAKMALGMV